MVTDDGRAVGRWRPPFRDPSIGAAEAMQSLLVQNWVSVPGATFRTSSVRGLPLDVDLWYTADWDLWLRLARSNGLAIAPGEWAAFRLHAGSQTVVGSADLDDFRAQHEIVRERYALHAVDASPRVAARVGKAGRLSIETNVLLAALAGSGQRPFGPWLRAASTSPAVWARFLRCSRITERSLSRVRAGLLGRRDGSRDKKRR